MKSLLRTPSLFFRFSAARAQKESEYQGNKSTNQTKVSLAIVHEKIEFEFRAHSGSCDNLFEMVRYGFRARSSLFVPTGHLYSVLKACLKRDFTASEQWNRERFSATLWLLSVPSLPLAPRSRIASLSREETAWDWRSLDCSAVLFDATLLHAGKYLKPRESGIESLCGGLRDALRDAFSVRCLCVRCLSLRCLCVRYLSVRCLSERCLSVRCLSLRCLSLRCLCVWCLSLRCLSLRCLSVYDAFTYINAFRL